MERPNYSFKQISWVNTLFIFLTPIFAIGLTTYYLMENGFELGQWVMFLFFYYLTGLGITGGYHRLFAHRTYEANSFVKFVYLVFGAAAFQNSVLKWATDHRRHHKEVDTEADPYTIKKGFFFAHMGWLFLKGEPQYEGKYAPDLERDPLVMWQHKYYIPLAALFGFGLPMLIGHYLGSALGGLAVSGFLRIVVTHHCTFFVNSLAHYWGKQTYTDKNTARDNFLVAFFTYGEGYHNFHHRFEGDYRNGLKWYHWDPTKWTIRTLAFFGFAEKLKTVPDTEILKAKLRMEELRISQRLNSKWSTYQENITSLRLKVEEAQLKVRKLRDDYRKMKSDFRSAKDEKVKALRADLALAKLEFRLALQEWRGYTRVLVATHA